MSLVTVITPAYNASQFLEETVKSVQAQTFTDWEMIIVDDFSTDGTFELASSLAGKDSRIKALRNEKNSGVSAARNKALDSASGKYMAFLDADDLWLPKKLEKQVAFMENGQYVLSYTNFRKFDSDTGELKPKILKAPEKVSAVRLYGDTSIGCLTVMVNREMSGPFHMPPLSHAEDIITWQDILAKGYTGYRINEVLSLYRERDSSLSGSKTRSAGQQWRIYRDYYKFSLPKSAYYYTQYAFRAFKKHFL